MNTPLLAYQTWISLPREIRQKLAQIFEIPRTGESVVRTGMITPQGNIGGEATSDGHSAKDLYALTTEKMQTYLDSKETDFHVLFSKVLAKIDPESAPAVAPKPTAPRPKSAPKAKAAPKRAVKKARK